MPGSCFPTLSDRCHISIIFVGYCFMTTHLIAKAGFSTGWELQTWVWSSFSVIFRQQLFIMRHNFTDVYCRMWNSNYQGFDGCLPCVYHFKNFEENHHRQAISYQNIPILYQFFLEFFGIDNSGFMTNWWIFSTQIKLHSFAIHFIVGYMHKKRKFRC